LSNINIVNGWEITKIVLAKQKNFSNETKVNNNRVKKINFLYYLVNERFMLLNTWIESVKYSYVKEIIEIFKCEKKNI